MRWLAAAVVLGLGLWLAAGRRLREPSARPLPAPVPTSSAPSTGSAPVTGAASGRPVGEQAPALVVGAADACKASPRFVAGLGFTGQVLVGTGLKGYKGLTLTETDGKGGVARVYQDPSWTTAGYLAAYVYDRNGDIYTAPAPLVSLYENPPDKQSRIYRVDSDTGKMAEYLELPTEQPPNQTNPFAVLGLAYDCDTHSLYAASVAGSTPEQQNGRIYRIDLDAHRVADVLDKIDAFGVGVFNGAHGKRLYFGSARDTGVYSIALDASGAFRGDKRLEFYLAALPQGSNEKAKRILFRGKDEMLIKGYDFNFSLRAASAYSEGLYFFRYDPAADRWQLEHVERESGGITRNGGN